jgi:hypothetical protein
MGRLTEESLPVKNMLPFGMFDARRSSTPVSKTPAPPISMLLFLFGIRRTGKLYSVADVDVVFKTTLKSGGGGFSTAHFCFGRVLDISCFTGRLSSVNSTDDGVLSLSLWGEAGPDRPTDQPTDQPTDDRPTDQPTSQPTDRPRPTDRDDRPRRPTETTDRDDRPKRPTETNARASERPTDRPRPTDRDDRPRRPTETTDRDDRTTERLVARE